MELEVKWTNFARNELRNIYDYYKNNVSINTATKIVTGIIRTVSVLEKHPEIGPIEELLKKNKEGFRYLLSKRNYKIIYWINKTNQTIEIVDIFDVRQNPIKMDTRR